MTLNRVQRWIARLFKFERVFQDAYHRGDTDGFQRAIQAHPDCMRCQYHPVNAHAKPMAYYQAPPGTLARVHKEMERKKMQTQKLDPVATMILEVPKR